MKYAIYDKITDEYLCKDGTWYGYDDHGFSDKEPLSFLHKPEAKQKIEELKKEFIAHDPESKLDFEIVGVRYAYQFLNV